MDNSSYYSQEPLLVDSIKDIITQRFVSITRENLPIMELEYIEKYNEIVAKKYMIILTYYTS